MIKKYLGVGTALLAILCSSFNFTPKAKPSSNSYFLYFPLLDFTESGFENPNNWVQYNYSSSIFCLGYNNPCVVRINADDIIHYPNNTPEEDFTAKLASITSSTPYTVYGYSYTSARSYSYGERTDSKN